MSDVTFSPIAFRLTQIEKHGSFGRAVVLRRGSVTLRPEIQSGKRHGGYKAPDRFEYWNIKLDLPWLTRWRGRKQLRRDSHIAMEFWSETDVASDGDRYIHWLFPSVRWNERLSGRTFAGTFMPADDPAPDGIPVPNGGFWKTDQVPV